MDGEATQILHGLLLVQLPNSCTRLHGLLSVPVGGDQAEAPYTRLHANLHVKKHFGRLISV